MAEQLNHIIPICSHFAVNTPLTVAKIPIFQGFSCFWDYSHSNITFVLTVNSGLNSVFSYFSAQKIYPFHPFNTESVVKKCCQLNYYWSNPYKSYIVIPISKFSICRAAESKVRVNQSMPSSKPETLLYRYVLLE